MSKDDLKILFREAEKINLNDLSCNNTKKLKSIKQIYQFIQTLNTNYKGILEKFETTKIRFDDYYDAENYHGLEIINYFNESYPYNDKTEVCELFALYVILKNAQDLICGFDLYDGDINTLYDELNNNGYFEDILSMIDYLEEKRALREEQEENELDFLNPDNKYKILFTGFAHKDILSLEKNTKKSLIKKISKQLATSEVVPLTEAVDHVKCLYDFPLFRVQLADDYRIAYIRRKNVTAILGITLKTGRDIDYSRYDAIAKNSEQIYREIDLFSNDLLDGDSQHYKTVAHLQELNKKRNK